MARLKCNICQNEKEVDIKMQGVSHLCCNKEMQAKKVLTELTTETFNEYVYGRDGIALLFVYLKGDKHSVEAEPILERLNALYEDEMCVYRVDGEKNDMIIKGFMVRALPTLILFSNGRLMDIKTGVSTFDKTLAFLRRTVLI